MGSQDQTRTADLARAISEHNEAQQRAREEKQRAEREAAERQMKADASLYGTAGWEALSDRRRHQAAHWSAQQVQGGAGDAA
ncbi:hypothetical protein ABZ760_21170 [Streptomyces sp. NPDC006658]|uniref:hypothetical protein n=1 Tax=Streptomyces sp. NPDC006658 TaxID=3156900 RepID=UPI0034019356